MSLYDNLYLDIGEKIITAGYYDENRTGVNTYKLPHQIMQFDLSREFPILTTKRVAFITAIKELLWIFKEQSNSVTRLRESGVHIWDEWELDNGTIGTSYGYIVRKYNQMDNLLKDLKNNPQSRRMMINLWQNQYLDTGALHPCCFLTMWDVTCGRLNCMLVQRSGDWGLGVPFNTSQYAALTLMIAHVTGHKPGLFTHVINNAHIYENHVEAIKLQISRREKAYPAPQLWLNENIRDFYDFTHNDIKLINYRHHDEIKMEVSV